LEDFMSDIVPRSQLTKQGVQGTIAVAGGIGVLVLASLGGLLGVVVGAVIAVVGIALSGGKKERTAGLVIAGLGAVTAVSSLPVLGSLFGGLFHWIMGAGGVILLAVGGISLFRFFSNLRKRA
jgi:hypothetical protein